MKKLLNTLFVTTEDAYLSLDGENVVVNREKQELARFPLHTLSGIIAFTYAGASPALMGACAKRDIALSFCTPRGIACAEVAHCRSSRRRISRENGRAECRSSAQYHAWHMRP